MFKARDIQIEGHANKQMSGRKKGKLIEKERLTVQFRDMKISGRLNISAALPPGSTNVKTPAKSNS